MIGAGISVSVKVYGDWKWDSMVRVWSVGFGGEDGFRKG